MILLEARDIHVWGWLWLSELLDHVQGILGVLEAAMQGPCAYLRPSQRANSAAFAACVESFCEGVRTMQGQHSLGALTPKP